MAAERPPQSAVAIGASHEVETFDCGVPALDEYLKRYALQNHRAGAALTFVLLRRGRVVVGYYSLAMGSVEHGAAPERMRKGLGRHPVPVVILCRFAVDRSEQGKGYGKGLLRDALLRIVGAAGEVACRAVLVHAKDQRVAAFYRHFDFEPFPGDDLTLWVLLKDVRRVLGLPSPRS